MYYILFYETVDNYTEKRQPFRPEHLTMVSSAQVAGHIVMGGAFANPADGVAIVFKTDAKAIVEEFVKNDPYVQNDLVARWYIRDWTVVIGG